MKNSSPSDLNPMTSQKPYLLRALYEWIADNNMTVYIVANVEVRNIKVPMQYAQDGQITLNISPLAALKLTIDNHYINFSARFSGVPMQVVIPIGAVAAIYAKETGQGMFFEIEEETDESDEFSPEKETAREKEKPKTTSHPFKPNLKIIK